MLKTLGFVSDINEQIAYLRSCVIGLLINECAQTFLENEEKILEGEFEGSLIKHISELPAKTYKHCEALSMEKIYRSRDVLDIELAGFRIISTLLDLMIDAVRSPEKAYSQLLINRVSEQYNIKSACTLRKNTGGIGLHIRHDGCLCTRSIQKDQREQSPCGVSMFPAHASFIYKS